MKKFIVPGRILFGIPFVIFGINHFIMMDYYLGMLTSFIPLGAYTIILTGILLIAAGISIITRFNIRLASLLLAGMMLLFILTIHIPHLVHGSADRTITLIALLKDISLTGGALLIAGFCPEEKKEN